MPGFTVCAWIVCTCIVCTRQFTGVEWILKLAFKDLMRRRVTMLGTYSKYMNFTEEDPKCERVSVWIFHRVPVMS